MLGGLGKGADWRDVTSLLVCSRGSGYSLLKSGYPPNLLLVPQLEVEGLFQGYPFNTERGKGLGKGKLGAVEWDNWPKDKVKQRSGE